MKPVKRWFGLGPYDEDEGREIHWYNRHYEFNGTRIRFIVGDLCTEYELEVGGTEGPEFKICLSLCQEDIPEFYLPNNPNAEYDIHFISVRFWRWGAYLSIRGRVKT